MPSSIKSFGYIKENCLHLTAFLKGLINFVNNIQLFRERLSEKVHATIPKGIVSGFEFTFFPKKFERIGTKGHENVFASATGKQQK